MRHQGEPAMLKLPRPRMERLGYRLLEYKGGDGAARLLARDESGSARCRDLTRERKKAGRRGPTFLPESIPEAAAHGSQFWRLLQSSTSARTRSFSSP
ncbi:aminoglycoside phosphotransferase family protein [Bosea vaviloviae]|uniref:aminoglycoside phosphotransferase family protein n=1 Tax=Bosea vaviloviae TaxID=1526658 RepID=UPI003CC7B0B8